MLATLFGAVTAEACVVPLEEASGKYMVKDEKNVSVENAVIEIRPGSGTASYSLELALKNNGEEDTTVIVGLPKFFYSSLSNVSSVSVSINGSSVSVKSYEGSANEAIEYDPGFTSYYSWTVDIRSGETVYMTAGFAASTRAYNNGTQVADLPLRALTTWAGDVGNVEIKFDSLALDVYSYNRAPSLEPTKLYDGGMLEWKIPSGSDISKNLAVYYDIDFNVIQKYFSNIYKSGDEKTAAELFRQKKFNEAVNVIDSELSSSVDFQFMKMVCLEKLGRISQANDILAELYDKDVCFSSNGEYDMSEYAKKRMLFNYYLVMSKKASDIPAANKMLSKGIKSLSASKSSLFIDWAKKTASVEVSDDPSTPGKKEEDDPKGEKFSFKKWLSEMSDPLILAFGILLIVVVVFCIMGLLSGNKPKKTVKKHSMKR